MSRERVLKERASKKKKKTSAGRRKNEVPSGNKLLLGLILHIQQVEKGGYKKTPDSRSDGCFIKNIFKKIHGGGSCQAKSGKGTKGGIEAVWRGGGVTDPHTKEFNYRKSDSMVSQRHRQGTARVERKRSDKRCGEGRLPSTGIRT